MKKITLAIISTITPFSFALATCNVNGHEVPCSQFPWWIFVVLFVIGIAFFVFWLRMLIHVVKTPVPNKVVWIICMVLFNLPTAVIYYFVVKKNFNNVIN